MPQKCPLCPNVLLLKMKKQTLSKKSSVSKIVLIMTDVPQKYSHVPKLFQFLNNAPIFLKKKKKKNSPKCPYLIEMSNF